MPRYKETLRVTPYDIAGKTMIDIRYWKDTPMGPRQTDKSVQVDRKLLTRLIWALQVANSRLDSSEAKEAAGIQG
jgi:hypothetical protein